MGGDTNTGKPEEGAGEYGNSSGNDGKTGDVGESGSTGNSESGNSGSVSSTKNFWKEQSEKYGKDVADLFESYGEDVINVLKSKRTIKGVKSLCEGGCDFVQDLIESDFEDYLVKIMEGEGSFNVEGREFDGRLENRWWEAKSGKYWELIENNNKQFDKFKPDMGNRLDIAIRNDATYELFSNTPIPEIVKEWLKKKSIIYTELLY